MPTLTIVNGLVWLVVPAAFSPLNSLAKAVAGTAQGVAGGAAVTGAHGLGASVTGAHGLEAVVTGAHGDPATVVVVAPVTVVVVVAPVTVVVVAPVTVVVVAPVTVVVAPVVVATTVAAAWPTIGVSAAWSNCNGVSKVIWKGPAVVFWSRRGLPPAAAGRHGPKLLIVLVSST